MNTIAPPELHNLQSGSADIAILDVRTPAEFASVHAETAFNVPLDRLDPSDVMKSRSSDKPLYVICKSGARSRSACDKFIAAGYTNVVNVEGGTESWDAAGLPVNRGNKEVLPLDCQVRVAAGGLIVLGSLLSFFAPAGALLAAFVGAGLVYSGMTNTCAVSSMFAKMPWNNPKNIAAKPSELPIAETGGPACDTGG